MAFCFKISSSPNLTIFYIKFLSQSKVKKKIQKNDEKAAVAGSQWECAAAHWLTVWFTANSNR